MDTKKIVTLKRCVRIKEFYFLTYSIKKLKVKLPPIN